jgi:multimeric flavodoxin WrbA
MKVIAFNGSPRKNGNTEILINYVLNEIKKEGIETEYIQIGGRYIKGCAGCRQCFVNKNQKCIFDDDPVNEYIQKMLEADAIIIGSPTYFSDMTMETKALIDRCGMVARGNDNMFKHKVGAAVVAVRRGGANHVFSSINYFFLVEEMIVPGSIYWNFGIGKEIGEVEEDEEGIMTMKTLGKNIAWLLKKIND